MSAFTYVLAVDGGGTKTAAALLTRDGRRLAACRSGPSNLYRDSVAGLASITDAWLHLCADAGLEPVGAARQTIISAGLAGVSGAEQRRAFTNAFPSFAARHLSSDGYTAFLGVFGAAPGALLSIGTGVVAYRRLPGELPAVRSGWGFPVADRGSGAWLGFRLAGEYLDHLDGGAVVQDSSLWPVAAKAIGRGREAILDWLKNARAAEFAGLAPAVIAASAAGDALAAALLAEGAAHLLRLARALDPSVPASLCLGGGLASIYRPGLETALGDRMLPATSHPDPLHGAWLVATGQVAAEFSDVS